MRKGWHKKRSKSHLGRLRRNRNNLRVYCGECKLAIAEQNKVLKDGKYIHYWCQ